MFLFITMLLLIQYIAESYRDYYVILSGQTNPQYNQPWHNMSAAINAVMLIVLSVATMNPWYMALGAFCRLGIFNGSLNILRNKGFFYLSDHGMDAAFKKIFGKMAPYIVLIVSAIMIVFINYMNFNN